MKLTLLERRGLLSIAKENFFKAKKGSSALNRMYIRVNNIKNGMNMTTIGGAIITIFVGFLGSPLLTAFIAAIPGVMALIERTYKPVEKCRIYNEAKNKLEKFASNSSILSSEVYSFKNYDDGKEAFLRLREDIDEIIINNEIIRNKIDKKYADEEYPNSMIKMAWNSLELEENRKPEQSEVEGQLISPPIGS